MDIQKATDPAELKPLTWSPIFIGEKQTTYVVDLHGHLLNLRGHEIAEDGTVTPSVLATPCGFHEFLKLIGWKSMRLLER